MSKKRIVVVDQDPKAQAVARVVFQTEFPNVEVVASADGYKGLLALSKRRTDLVLIDIEAPGLNGVELTSALREQGNPTSIVVLSARADHDDWRVLKGLGADGFLLKPLDPDALLALARQLIAAAMGRGDTPRRARLPHVAPARAANCALPR